MRKKRFISYLLVGVFSFLFLKNLLPDVAELNLVNHNEIGHIHFFQSKNKPSSNSLSVVAGKSGQKKSDDENCSSGKSLFSYLNVPNEASKIAVPKLKIAFEFVFDLKNNIKTPYLEPRLKPPCFA
jgi:hypothetical protein